MNSIANKESMAEVGSQDMRQKDESNIESGTDETRLDEKQYPPLKVVIPTILCLNFALFLVALDRTIVGVAVPAISNEFQSFRDISWYEAAFLLTLCVFQLPMGKIYKYFSAKWTLVVIVVIFEVGSIVCAAAPSSTAFIIGRAITGIGAAGTAVGVQVNIADLVPARKRPKYQGLSGAVFGISSIVGPLMGGAFTSDISWRWCFWISVPIGGFALAGILFILPASPPPKRLEGTFWEALKLFDPIGNTLLAPGVVCILLAVQWGGTEFSWNDGRIITLLVVGPVLLMAFAVVQCWVKENGTVPPRIIRQRSIAAGTVAYLGIGSSMIVAAFYLPIWFQAIRGISAGSAGVRLLPLFLSTVIVLIVCGFVISKVGYYTPFLIVGCAILMIGSALLTTIKVDTGTGPEIGYQLLVGAGIGLSLQQPNNAAQTVLNREDIPIGITILQFASAFGGAVFVSVSQTVLSNTLASQLARTLPGFDISAIAGTGATDIRNLVPNNELSIVLKAYDAGIANTFYCALGTACLSFLASLFFEWRTVLSRPEKSAE